MLLHDKKRQVRDAWIIAIIVFIILGNLCCYFAYNAMKSYNNHEYNEAMFYSKFLAPVFSTFRHLRYNAAYQIITNRLTKATTVSFEERRDIKMEYSEELAQLLHENLSKEDPFAFDRNLIYHSCYFLRDFGSGNFLSLPPAKVYKQAKAKNKEIVWLLLNVARTVELCEMFWVDNDSLPDIKWYYSEFSRKKAQFTVDNDKLEKLADIHDSYYIAIVRVHYYFTTAVLKHKQRGENASVNELLLMGCNRVLKNGKLLKTERYLDEYLEMKKVIESINYLPLKGVQRE